MIRYARPILVIILISVLGIFFFFHQDSLSSPSKPSLAAQNDGRLTSLFVDKLEDENRFSGDNPVGLEMGGTIMSELGNATIKAELGRAAWRLIHTVAARFPINPKKDEQDALKQWILLFSRLYPCGQCARHFQAVLVKNPPRVENRTVISEWACDVHNVVNKRLDKPQFNCSTVLEHWKCGCDDVTD